MRVHVAEQPVNSAGPAVVVLAVVVSSPSFTAVEVWISPSLGSVVVRKEGGLVSSGTADVGASDSIAVVSITEGDLSMVVLEELSEVDPVSSELIDEVPDVSSMMSVTEGDLSAVISLTSVDILDSSGPTDVEALDSRGRVLVTEGGPSIVIPVDISKVDLLISWESTDVGL